MGFKEYYIKEVKLNKERNPFKTFIMDYSKWIPLSEKMFQRALGKVFTGYAYHVTSFENMQSLVKLQGKKKSLSTFTDVESEQKLIDMLGGIATGGGILAELKGNVILSTPIDAFTSTDRQGRRWLPTSYIGDLTLNSKLDSAIVVLKDNLMTKYKLKTIDGVQARFSNVDGFEDLAPIDGKTMANITKDYIDGIEDILKRDEIKKLFLALYTQDTAYGYNEVVMNNIKIIQIYYDPRFTRIPDKIAKKLKWKKLGEDLKDCDITYNQVYRDIKNIGKQFK